MVEETKRKADGNGISNVLDIEKISNLQHFVHCCATVARLSPLSMRTVGR